MFLATAYATNVFVSSVNTTAHTVMIAELSAAFG